MAEDSVGLGELVRTVHRIEDSQNKGFEGIAQNFKELKFVDPAVYKAEQDTLKLRITLLETARRNLAFAVTGIAVTLIGDLARQALHLGP